MSLLLRSLLICGANFPTPSLALENGVGLLPALAFSTWNRFLYGINESLMFELADAIVATGLRDAGFEYINIDAGAWLHTRDAAGNLQANPALFPHGLSPVAAYLAARGLKLGVYTDLGTGSCGPGPGSAGHWAQDAALFASIPASYLKVDFCGGPQDFDPARELAAWGEVAAALNATGRPIYLSICPKSNAPKNLTGPLQPYAGEGGLYFPPLAWTREEKRSVANAWLVEVRNNVDGWGPSTSSCKDVGAPCGMITNIDSQVALGKWEETGPGGLVDADILEVCQFNGTVNRPGLTESEGRLHFYIWAVLPSPLIISFDPRTILEQPGGPACLAMVKNTEILAVNQDAAVHGARLLRQGGAAGPPITSEQVTFQVFGRPLAASGSFAAVLANRAEVALNVTLDWGELGLGNPSGEASVRDVGAGADLGNFKGGFMALIPARDAMMVVVKQPAAAA